MGQKVEVETSSARLKINPKIFISRVKDSPLGHDVEPEWKGSQIERPEIEGHTGGGHIALCTQSEGVIEHVVIILKGT
jgi:hypothetical protein